jgi:hypothetical protein
MPNRAVCGAKRETGEQTENSAGESALSGRPPWILDPHLKAVAQFLILLGQCGRPSFRHPLAANRIAHFSEWPQSAFDDCRDGYITGVTSDSESPIRCSKRLIAALVERPTTLRQFAEGFM